jgi:hypothetical protein
MPAVSEREPLAGQFHRKGDLPAGRHLHENPAAVKLHNSFRKRKPEAGALFPMLSLLLIKQLERPGGRFFRDVGAPVHKAGRRLAVFFSEETETLPPLRRI